MRFVDDLPSKSQIVDCWRERLPSLGFFVDWGEPSCWACRFHYETKYDIKRSDASWEEALACWERMPLQRCHIVPRSLGGSNDASNLFLMCRECHDLAPNTSISEIFLEWAKAQSWHEREAAKIRAALDSFDIDPTFHEELLGEINADEGLKSWLSGKFSIHRPQSSYAPFSARFTPATLIGLALHYWRVQGREINAWSQSSKKEKSLRDGLSS